MKRHGIIVLWTLFSAVCPLAQAEHSPKVPRIGYLAGGGAPTTPGPSVIAFRQGLRDLGYAEGKNIVVEYRYVQGKLDRYETLVSDLISLNVDALVLTTAIRAAKEATKSIPIVMITTSDPVTNGIVNSLARPGGNITGLTRFTRALSGKRLELLKEMIPGLSRVGVIWDASSSGRAFKEYQTAAAALKMPLQSLEVRGPNPDFDSVFHAAKGRVNALVMILNPLFNEHRDRITDLAGKARLPAMYEGSTYVEAGGLVSYSADDSDTFRRAAYYVDKILKGAKPADLPIEQPTKFELVINLNTAKQIGVTIPPNVLARADKVIK